LPKKEFKNAEKESPKETSGKSITKQNFAVGLTEAPYEESGEYHYKTRLFYEALALLSATGYLF